MSEREKMLAGELYDALDPELVAMRRSARDAMRKYDAAIDDAERAQILGSLFGAGGATAIVEPPLRVDYGSHVSVGAKFYANFGCVILDCARVTIGNEVKFGPNVQLITATHPVEAAERVKGPELARPITIGNRVWLGAGVIVLPGVIIGDDTTIGAGSVVTRDVPAKVVAAGNPCRVLRSIE